MPNIKCRNLVLENNLLISDLERSDKFLFSKRSLLLSAESKPIRTRLKIVSVY